MLFSIGRGWVKMSVLMLPFLYGDYLMGFLKVVSDLQRDNLLKAE
jgi:hypothetical protein